MLLSFFNFRVLNFLALFVTLHHVSFSKSIGPMYSFYVHGPNFGILNPNFKRFHRKHTSTWLCYDKHCSSTICYWSRKGNLGKTLSMTSYFAGYDVLSQFLSTLLLSVLRTRLNNRKSRYYIQMSLFRQTFSLIFSDKTNCKQIHVGKILMKCHSQLLKHLTNWA